MTWVVSKASLPLLRTIPKNDNDLQVAAILAQLEDEHEADAVFVDAGYGTGIVSAGRTQGRNWQPVWFSAAATKPGFKNKRAETYWRIREALDPTNPEPLALPPDPELLGDLCAVRYKVVPMGQEAGIQMNSKDEIKELLGRSPDKGDAVSMTFDEDAPTAGAVEFEMPPPPDWRL